MLLRDAQEEVRIVYTARRDHAKSGEILLMTHITEATAILQSLKDMKQTDWNQMTTSKTRGVGLLLMVALGIANKIEIDSLQALKAVLLEESP